MRNRLNLADLAPILLVIVVGLLLFLSTRETFGQRCAEAFPNDGLRKQICIQKLSKGEPLEDLLATKEPEQ